MGLDEYACLVHSALDNEPDIARRRFLLRVFERFEPGLVSRHTDAAPYLVEIVDRRGHVGRQSVPGRKLRLDTGVIEVCRYWRAHETDGPFSIPGWDLR